MNVALHHFRLVNTIVQEGTLTKAAEKLHLTQSALSHQLKELEKELIKAGSSMEKVVKVNVYLDDIKDYKEMNDVFRGRFGKNPPVRTTVAVAKGGVPGDSLVEMDCIAIQ